MRSAEAIAGPRLLHAASQLLGAALGPNAEVSVLDGPRGRLHLRHRSMSVPDHDFVLQPWPGDLHRTPARKGPHAIWVTPRADAKTREMFRRHDQSFIDLASRTVRLHLPGLLLDRTAIVVERPPHTADKDRSPCSDLGSMVTRALLAEHGREWTLTQLAERAGVSKALASRVITHLRASALVRTERLGRALRIRLPDPWPLFLRWTGNYRWTDNETLAVAAPIGDAGRFLARFHRLMHDHAEGRRWALTLHAGASFTGRHAAWDTVHVYVACRTATELNRLAQRLGWEPSPQGRLVLMAPRYPRAVWWGLTAPSVTPVPVVDSIQLMLDLWHYPVRGREQAEHLARLLGWRALPQ